MRNALKACLVLLLGLPLAACSDDWWIFSEEAPQKDLEAPLALRPEPIHQSIHITAPDGAPAALAARLQEDLRATLADRGVLASSLETLESPFRLNTALKAASNASGVIVILVADVEEKGAGRLERILIEERLPASPGADKDVWLAVSDALLQDLASKTVDRLAGSPEFAALLDPASARRAPARAYAQLDLGPETGLAETNDTLVTGSTGNRAAAAPELTITVRTAPGNGRDALTRAVRAALDAEAEKAAGYFVTADVRTQPRGPARTHVEIDWMVLAPDGTPLGVVKQANEVGTDEIMEEWGAVAEAAGKEAAEGIRALLTAPETRS
ncbi:hypothetical protein ACSHT0_05865 [Tepidicaulis sp. LMO-SS28]|uniref:hypothetical protein n=1 Tax=Tepidicaulis sp. LMO-SS28 TaxID=3447455 RepID=UPI003EE18D7B